MSHRCRPASRLVAQMLVASAALACALPAAAADAPVDPLDLPVDERAQRPTGRVIIDGVDAQSVTVMRLSEWRARDIPATWFQREFLPRYQAGQ
jgi:hypothetical protein